MAAIRAVLLAVMGVLSGAWLGLDLLKNRAKRAVHDLKEPPPPQPRKLVRTRTQVKAQAKAVAASATGGATALAHKASDTVSHLLRRRDDEAGTDHLEKAGASDKPVSHPAGAAAHNDVRQIQGSPGYVMEVFKRFGADHCPAWAASLSFFSILSIPPVLLCGLAVLGFLIDDPGEAQRYVERALASVLPGAGDAAQKQARAIAEQFNIKESAQHLRDTSGIAFLIGIGSLVWAAMQIFVNATTPMNAAFGTEETRNWFQLRARALVLLIVVGLLFLVALLPSAGAQVINALRIPGLGRLPDPLPPILAFLFLLIGVAINALMFTIIYRFLPSPSAQIDWKEAGFAGIIVAILWEIAKQAFAFYLRRFGQEGYNKMYGSLGGLIGLVFWIFYTSMILLLGAEIAKLYSEWRDAHGKSPESAAASGGGTIAAGAASA